MAVIVIDPGHGGATKVDGSSPNNATSMSGLLEKDLTLTVARHTMAALSSQGHAVSLTRDADINLGLTARAHMARAAAADAFVSIHFNGFGDTSVQGTETWVHLTASPASRDLALCIQRAMLQTTGYRDRGVQAKRLGVLDPASHHAGTAACLAEVSFITTSAEDRRLQQPEYLLALGGAMARGVDDFVATRARVAVTATTAGRKIAGRRGMVAVRSGGPAPAPRREPSRGGQVRHVQSVPEVQMGQAVGPAAAAAAATLSVTNPKVDDVVAAIGSLPVSARTRKFSGKVSDKGGDFTHLQGIAAYKGVYFITQSDEFEDAGRLIVADRTKDTLLHAYRLPVVSTNPRYFHAGGCQVIGDILVVACEAQDNKSVVCFFDVSDPSRILEIPQLRIFNDTRDAATVGITNVTRNGREVWVLAVFDSGTVDVYQCPDLAARVPFVKIFSDKVSEKHHQAMPLVTDTADRVFALGINRTFFGEDIVVVYALDLDAGTVLPFPDASKSDFRFKTSDGGSLRWGTDLEIVASAGLVMHCTSKHYRNGCRINVFDPSAASVAAGKTKAAGKKAAAARTRKAARKTAPRRKPAARRGRPKRRAKPVRRRGSVASRRVRRRKEARR